ncbi:MAG TPA: hypothetical protein VEX35_02565 [Allosphingosinicella sp.]|nr:hypothetical protein [Allosphingosinicella sp.]
MTRINALFTAFFVGVIVLFFWWMDAQILKGLAYQPNMPATAAGVITALLVVTLVVERAAAAVNAVIFGDEERQAEYERIQAARANTGTAAAEAKLKTVLDKKARLRLLLSFVTGLFISAAGVRTLQGLVVLTAQSDQPAIVISPLLYPIDVVLTAALIAGGSASLAFLAAVLRDLAAPPPPAHVPGNPPADAVAADGETPPAQVTAPAPAPARTMSVGPRLV